MATDAANQAPPTPEAPAAPPDKIVFDDKQQEFVNNLIQDRMGKAAAEVRKENEKLAARIKELESKRPPNQGAPSGKEGEPDAVEFKRIAEQSAEDARLAREQLAAQAKLAEQAHSEVAQLRRDYAITSAASKQAFIDINDVIALTTKNVKVGEDGKVVILTDDGTQRYNAAFQPMSIDEFYQEVAAKRPYLVKSGATSGTGATGNQRSNLAASNGKYTLDQLFGSKSNAQLVNDLALKDPAEYKRLRAQAVEAGLVGGKNRR